MYLLLSAVYFHRHQYYNTDIEAYMGMVYRIGHPELSTGEIHRRVYDELRIKNPDLVTEIQGKKEEVTGENSYYKILAEDPSAYAEELELFVVKPLYHFTNAGFYKLGIPASTATFLTSFLSYCGIVMLIFGFLSRILPSQNMAFFLTLLFSFLKPLTESTRHASPDNLACFLLLSGIYCFVVWHRLFPAVLLLVLTLFTRPDYIIFFTLLTFFLFFYRKNFGLKSSWLLGFYAFLLFSFLLIEHLNRIPWSVLFMNQFIKVQLFPLTSPDQLSFAAYWSVIKSRFLFEINASWFPLLMLFIAIGAGASARPRSQLRVFGMFFLVVFFTVGIRFLVFPSLVNRMMLGYYLLILLGLVWWHSGRSNLTESTH